MRCGKSHASIVLCTDRQIADIKNFCCTPNGSVLSFDKTYNLGSFLVTPSTYKNLTLKRVSSASELIFVGPFFVHGNSDTSTFFFSFLYSRLASSDTRHLTVGPDDEHGMRKAMSMAFRGSVHVACTRHLQKNVQRYQQDN
jgi:hypothetical protein